MVIDLFGAVDVVFVFDVTGSMGSYIHAARQLAVQKANEIAQQGNLDLRFGLIAYRDHPPQDHSFAARVITPLGSQAQFQAGLNSLMPSGGGDHPESVFDGVMYAATHIQYRPNSERVVFLFGDAPPHGYVVTHGYVYAATDGFPQGCPCGLTSFAVIQALNNMRARFTAVCVSNDADTQRAWQELVDGTQGTYVLAVDAQQAMYATGSTYSTVSAEVSQTRLYAQAAEAIGSYNAYAVAEHLGWTIDEAHRVASLMDKRGLFDSLAVSSS